jgi:hypothetical protein
MKRSSTPIGLSCITCGGRDLDGAKNMRAANDLIQRGRPRRYKEQSDELGPWCRTGSNRVADLLVETLQTAGVTK